MQCTTHELDDFVRRSDELGGPGSAACGAFWGAFSFRALHPVDQSLDPFSEAYVAEQVKIYEELAGRSYEPHANEQTAFDVERHIAAVNPYDHPDPGGLAVHVQRLSRALAYAKPARGEVLLDMGCGWGLSSEVAAYLGLKVRGVDINPSFVRLVNERAKRNQAAISAVVSTFEEYTAPEPVDLVLFYECLHHAVRPWVVVERVAGQLRDGGRIVMAGEPINAFWWRHWGLRLDPLSVYCIRKFGWFESGWSLAFINKVLLRAGLTPRVHANDDPEIGFAIVARKERRPVSGEAAAALFQASGCVVEGDLLIFAGSGSLTIDFPRGATGAVLDVTNNRGRPLRVSVTSDGAERFRGEMPPGTMPITVPRGAETAEVRLAVERWVPDEEVSNGDRRIIGLHMSGVSFTYEPEAAGS